MEDFKTMGDMIAPVFGVGKVFEPTNNFRWMNFVGQKTLQQAWICKNTGEVDWRNVPEVAEE
jgi:hypothetical protein